MAKLRSDFANEISKRRRPSEELSGDQKGDILTCVQEGHSVPFVANRYLCSPIEVQQTIDVWEAHGTTESRDLEPPKKPTHRDKGCSLKLARREQGLKYSRIIETRRVMRRLQEKSRLATEE
jgi:hypothetical protein